MSDVILEGKVTVFIDPTLQSQSQSIREGGGTAMHARAHSMDEPHSAASSHASSNVASVLVTPLPPHRSPPLNTPIATSVAATFLTPPASSLRRKIDGRNAVPESPSL